MSPKEKAAAWRNVARRWEREAVRGARGLWVLGSEDDWYGEDSLCFTSGVTDEMADDMLRVNDERGYWWPRYGPEGKEGANQRVWFACLMAAITEAGDLP